MASKSAIANVLKAKLVDAQLKVTELLESVILDGKTRTITEEDTPVAVIMPYAKYLKYEAEHS